MTLSEARTHSRHSLSLTVRLDKLASLEIGTLRVDLLFIIHFLFSLVVLRSGYLIHRVEVSKNADAQCDALPKRHPNTFDFTD